MEIEMQKQVYIIFNRETLQVHSMQWGFRETHAICKKNKDLDWCNRTHPTRKEFIKTLWF